MMQDPYQPIVQIPASTVIRNIGQLITVAQQPIPGARGPLRVIEHATMAIYNGMITWIGSDNERQPSFLQDPAGSITLVDAQGAVVTPGFVDSHTHLVFAGSRAEEFHQRHAGTSYGELLAQGRGILTTMKATREADPATLIALARTRLDAMQAHGTTTVEIKTGYGLNSATEEACLRIINKLNALEESSPPVHTGMRIVPTFLGAHSIPPEYADRRAAYVDLVMEEMLPAFVGLARFCDVFCEREAFTLEESRRILTRARELGYLLKLHADQLSASGASGLAAELGATSADHLDYASDSELDAMREAGVVATLLPGCSFTLRGPYPSARRLSYCENMQMILALAMSAMGMSLEEALTAATINGARALALQELVGSVEVGKQCELIFWSINDYHELGYHFGTNLVKSVLVQR